jgi:uncharacterized protein YbjT (DUF2867 family)
MYAVAGVSGNTGAVVADELLQQGERVRVIVRSKAKGEPWESKGAEIAVASVEDATSLTEALRGVDGVYLLAPPDMGSTDLDARGKQLGEAFARAVKESGVKHVVLLSSIGAHQDSGTGPIITVHHIENALRGTGANVTFLRPTYFMENWAAGLGPAQENGVLPSFLAKDEKIPMVATHDIGKVAASALRNPPSGERVINIAGPQDYTPAEIAKELGAVLGKEVTIAEGPLDAVVPTFTSFGISEHVAGKFREMYEGLGTGRVAWDGKGEQVRGETPPSKVFRGLLAH